MARNAHASFETLSEFLKNYASEPLTAKQIIDNMKLMESATGLKLSAPTIYRLLSDDNTTERAMHGIGTHRGKPNRFMYTEKAKKAAARTITDNVHLALREEAEFKANKTAQFAHKILEANLTPDALSVMVERKKQLEEEIDALQFAKADFIQDELEERLLFGFRAAREAYGDEDKLTKNVGLVNQVSLTDLYNEASKAFKNNEDDKGIVALALILMKRAKGPVRENETVE